MKIIKTIAPIDVIVDKHPLYKNINKRLMNDIEKVDFSNPNPEIVTGQMSAYGTDSENISSITNWVYSLIVKHYHLNITADGYKSTEKLTFYNCWFIKYKKGEKTITHHHIPSSFSFVYFLQTPKNSVPMIFTHSRTRIKAEEGKVVIFPGYVNHHVPKNRCDGRIVLVGNISNVTC